jgi:hypothetical protein
MKNVLVIVIPVIHPTAAKENLIILFSTLSNSLVKIISVVAYLLQVPDPRSSKSH